MILLERAAGAKFLYRTCRLCWFSNRNMGSNISRNTFEPSNALLGTLSSLGGPRRLPEFGGPLRHSPPIWGPPLTFSLQFGGPSLGPDLGAPLPFSKNFGAPRGPRGPPVGGPLWITASNKTLKYQGFWTKIVATRPPSPRVPQKRYFWWI